MTPEQYDRWRDFAERMARMCFTGRRRPDALWVQEQVATFFESIVERDSDEARLIIDWDNSDDYDRREHQRSYCLCRIGNNGTPKADCEECRGSGLYHRPTSGPLCCDIVTQWLDNCAPSVGCCRACRQYRYDDGYDGSCRCDELEMIVFEQWNEQWGGPVRCCIRAGLDMASAPSAGVIGFTAGDVRRMYPEGVPDWIFPPDERLHYWLSDELNGTFAELDDSAGLVL